MAIKAGYARAEPFRNFTMKDADTEEALAPDEE
jgi:hypothetical protein